MINPQDLAKSLATGFDMDELKTLAFQVGVQFDDLDGGGTVTGKARELVQHCERRDTLDMLVAAAMTERPSMYWNEVADDVPARTLKFMLPMIASGTKKLNGILMARFEARLNRYEELARERGKCMHQIKNKINITLTLVIVLFAKELLL